MFSYHVYDVVCVFVPMPRNAAEPGKSDHMAVFPGPFDGVIITLSANKFHIKLSEYLCRTGDNFSPVRKLTGILRIVCRILIWTCHTIFVIILYIVGIGIFLHPDIYSSR